jgi:hypothetical protein
MLQNSNKKKTQEETNKIEEYSYTTFATSRNDVLFFSLLRGFVGDPRLWTRTSGKHTKRTNTPHIPAYKEKENCRRSCDLSQKKKTAINNTKAQDAWEDTRNLWAGGIRTRQQAIETKENEKHRSREQRGLNSSKTLSCARLHRPTHKHTYLLDPSQRTAN